MGDGDGLAAIYNGNQGDALASPAEYGSRQQGDEDQRDQAAQYDRQHPSHGTEGCEITPAKPDNRHQQ
jgi:hypothetical protein